jgi:uncharacterized protein (DUF488 family)
LGIIVGIIMTSVPVIYSIGHSDHEPEAFVALLQRYGISTVVDVRSQPYSRWVPQANRETLARTLKESGLTYIFMGDSLGGRPSDPSLYDAEDPDGAPDYERVAAAPAFQAGLEKLFNLANEATVAMMCSEGDHRRCHRTLLITPHLLERDVRVVHIRPDGESVEARPEPKQLSLF